MNIAIRNLVVGNILQAARENLEYNWPICSYLPYHGDTRNFHLFAQLLVSQPDTLLDNLSQSCQVIDVV